MLERKLGDWRVVAGILRTSFFRYLVPGRLMDVMRLRRDKVIITYDVFLSAQVLM